MVGRMGSSPREHQEDQGEAVSPPIKWLRDSTQPRERMVTLPDSDYIILEPLSLNSFVHKGGRVSPSYCGDGGIK